jgi:predicted nucleic acid-binding protein
MTTVIDTDILIGLFSKNDPLHDTATRLHRECQQRGARIYLPTAILSEFATVALKYMELIDVQQAVRIIEPIYTLVDVDVSLMNNALSLYYKQTSKKNTLFDCSVMAAAQKYKADCVLACDEGYKKNGFTLVEDYLRHDKSK